MSYSAYKSNERIDIKITSANTYIFNRKPAKTQILPCEELQHGVKCLVGVHVSGRRQAVVGVGWVSGRRSRLLRAGNSADTLMLKNGGNENGLNLLLHQFGHSLNEKKINIRTN